MANVAPDPKTGAAAFRPAEPGADPMLPRPFRVASVRRDLEDVITLTLAPADGRPAPAFAPGQFNMLYAFGVGEIPISFSGGAPAGGSYRHTVRAVGAVSAALCCVRRGHVVGVRGPFGTAWPVKQAAGRDLVFVAGGIGLAPLRPAFLYALAHRKDYGRVALVYGARTPEDVLFRREVERWRGRVDVTVRVTVDRGDASWRGAVGVVTQLLAGLAFDPGNATALVCGPEVMMKFSALELEGRGVPLEQVHVSLERNMKCAIGMCGHCQLGPEFVCKDGAVFPYPRVAPLMAIPEL